MTIENVIEIVENETGHKVNADTDLKHVVGDSLDFLELLLRFPAVPDAVISRINTVHDLFMATNGAL